ncbi:MAG: hypothetical protein VYA70_06450, partial [Gemmatimonadota bacterium]|nr:hypothetical protein [Gemmatimonadota bacterium]
QLLYQLSYASGSVLSSLTIVLSQGTCEHTYLEPAFQGPCSGAYLTACAQCPAHKMLSHV